MRPSTVIIWGFAHVWNIVRACARLQPSLHHTNIGPLVNMADANGIVSQILSHLAEFFHSNPQIKASHGLSHALAVHGHAVSALARLSLSASDSTEIQAAALLHDVDDRKYFPESGGGEGGGGPESLTNARRLCALSGISPPSVERICRMITWVSCSKNGNAVPSEVSSSGAYQWLIPRWSDRLEAVGAIGVIRCYQFNKEKRRPLCSAGSPRATSAEQVFALATPGRFEQYIRSGGKSDDMISHYYDKLLHVARPPPSIVRNSYLEEMAEESSRELVEVCVRFGKTGKVDLDYITALERNMGLSEGQRTLTDSSAANFFLDSMLPPGLLPTILSDFCDTKSLSAFLSAYASKSEGRLQAIGVVGSAISMRIASLRVSKRMPLCGTNNMRWNRQTVNIAGHLGDFCHYRAEAGDDSGEWNTAIRSIKRLALTFPALCFFEDERALGCKTLEYVKHKSHPERFELPLWVGFLPLRDDPGIPVIVTAPVSSWAPIQLSEWAKLNQGLRRNLCDGPRRATPFPPLARIRALKSSDNEKLRILSYQLNGLDTLFEVDVPSGCRMLLMSKCQAFQRLANDPVGTRLMTQNRDIFLAEAWSLGYRAGSSTARPVVPILHQNLPLYLPGERERTFADAITDPFHLDLVSRDRTNWFDDLFVFMEPTDESNDTAGEKHVIEMINHIEELFGRYQKLTHNLC